MVRKAPTELRLLLICCLLVPFEVFMIWFGTWGQEYGDMYSQIVSFGFPSQIGTFFFPEALKRRGIPGEILLAAFVAFMICLMSIPFIPFLVGPLSAGFGLAVTADTIFKAAFLCYRFVPTKQG